MEYRNVLTTCPYCGAGCKLYLQVLDGEIIGVLPDKEHPISRGELCIKGWNAASFVRHPDRLTRPLIRRGDGPSAELQEATWDGALDLIAERLSDVRNRFGSDAVGFLASAKCTNEENYLIQKLARAVVKTNNVDHCARL